MTSPDYIPAPSSRWSIPQRLWKIGRPLLALFLPVIIFCFLGLFLYSNESLRASIISEYYHLTPIISFAMVVIILFNYNFWLGFWGQTTTLKYPYERLGEADSEIEEDFEALLLEKKLKSLENRNELNISIQRLEFEQKLASEKRKATLEQETKLLKLRLEKSLIEENASKDEMALRTSEKILKLELSNAKLKKQLLTAQQEVQNLLGSTGDKDIDSVGD